jgi:hypothetical protein
MYQQIKRNMKFKTLIQLASVMTIILMIDGCALFPDVDDECLKNNWEAAKEPIIYVRMTSSLVTFTHDMTQYDMSLASSMTVTGTISKVYCSGKESGTFPVEAQILPSGGAIPLTNVKIGGPYQFKFQNDEDRVELRFKLRVTFPDGKIFETNDLWDSFFYNDIRLNANNLEYYVLYTLIGTAPMTNVGG